ncbi:hypothetical protein EDF57_101885 [Novosphingobium sp. PhB55]|uniref:hypothetical protein n=1 Tax=Novosphingobium sp. PhB55 TaxID=2485106 RepID=UPI001065AC87|nr:hypothetical protein [Novosphingobium sp. PhB55]TDW68991.1 hypothetical protein EDF57_101885 [Novosphingobium sp. PhB55]
MLRLRMAVFLLPLACAVGPGVLAQEAITVGRWAEGSLSHGDLRTDDGRFFDEYAVDVIEGQVYTIEALSDDFTPMIRVEGPGGNIVLSKPASTGVLIERFRFARGGRYVVQVSGVGDGATGGYRLRIRRLGPEVDDTRNDQTDRIGVVTALPPASLKTAIRSDCLSGKLDFGEVFDRLKASSAEYDDPGLFLTRRGFGIVTRFERIDDRGVAIASDRWDTAPFYNSFFQVISHQAQPGRYRSYMFVYDTGMPDNASSRTLAEIADWVTAGAGLELPSAYRGLRGGKDHYLQIFVYEYERASIGSPTLLVRPTPRQRGHLGSAVARRVSVIFTGGDCG